VNKYAPKGKADPSAFKASAVASNKPAAKPAATPEVSAAAKPAASPAPQPKPAPAPAPAPAPVVSPRSANAEIIEQVLPDSSCLPSVAHPGQPLPKMKDNDSGDRFAASWAAKFNAKFQPK
jgi:hypothetical protein